MTVLVVGGMFGAIHWGFNNPRECFVSSAPQLISIQALRGLAALVVVLFHASVLTVDYMGGALYSPWTLIGKAGVDLFFVISGFVMVYTTRVGFDVPGAATRFAVSRISRVYPPYWILAAIVFAYWLYNPGGVNAKNGGVDPLASFLLLPSTSLPLVPVAWTLVHEVFFYAMFWALIALGSRRLLAPALAVWGAACLANVAAGLVDQSSMARGLLLSPYNVEFVAGAFAALIAPSRLGRAIVCLGVLWFVALAGWFAIVQQPEAMHVAWRVAVFAPPCLALVYGFVSAESAGAKAPSVLAWIGDWSYSLYLVHILIIHAVYRLATRRVHLEWTSPPAAAGLACMVTVAALIAGYLYFRYVERPVSRRAREALSALVSRLRLTSTA